MILTRVIRCHVLCDDCRAAYIRVDGPDVRPPLAEAKWVVDGERHICPRCARRRG